MKNYIIGLCLSLITAVSNASLLVGDTIIVSYDSLSSLYGTPVINGDTLTFSPIDFSASNIQLTPSTFTFNVKSKPGYSLSILDYYESGSYLNNSNVAINGQVRIKSLDPLLPTSTTFFTISDLLVKNTLTNWAAYTILSMSGVESQVTIQNLLYASVNSSIQKNYVEINFSSNVVTLPGPIPEPSSISLLMLGLVSLIVLSKKQRL